MGEGVEDGPHGTLRHEMVVIRSRGIQGTGDSTKGDSPETTGENVQMLRQGCGGKLDRQVVQGGRGSSEVTGVELKT